MRAKVRDAFSKVASKMRAVDIFGDRKQELLAEVRTMLEQELGPKGFKFDMISIVGGLRVDARVESAINAVIEANQRATEAEQKVRQSEAEAKQKIATAEGEAQSILLVAQAQAEANRLLSQSLTSNVIQWEATKKWDGIMPKVTGGSIPMIDLK
jgi:regulator of protease activity HflC (stomatin/prohibitin superfamily)